MSSTSWSESAFGIIHKADKVLLGQLKYGAHAWKTRIADPRALKDAAHSNSDKQMKRSLTNIFDGGPKSAVYGYHSKNPMGGSAWVRNK